LLVLVRLHALVAGIAALVAAAAPIVAGSPPAQAQPAQHQWGAMYADWNFGQSTGFWNIDQRIQVTRKARSTYWAMTWGFTAGGDGGGYLGIQTDGNRFDGSTGDTAIFSLWNADASRGPSCGTFTGEGEGRSCRAAFRIDPQVDYRLRVWRLENDGVGQWWGGWIRFQRSGQEIELGQLRVDPAKTLMSPPDNFTEYFGPAVSCDDVEISTVYFTQPAANQSAPDVYAVGSTPGGTQRAECTGGVGEVVDLGWTKAIKLTMGGPR
jgi:hypothetical protein